jgi:hypothetical protein
MTDNELDELERLRAENTELKEQVKHDTTTREELLAASEKIIPAITRDYERLRQRATATLDNVRAHPTLQQQREEAIGEKYARISARLADTDARMDAIEKAFDQMTRVIVNQHELLQLVLKDK